MERNFKIWRGDKEQGEFINYAVKLEQGMVVLDAIHRIQVEHANDLARLIKSRGKNWYLYHVNLIKYHPCLSPVKYVKPSSEAFQTFIDDRVSR